MMKKMGVKKAPKEAENEQYTNKWETVKEIDLDKDVPKKISIKEPDGLFYLPYWRSVRIIKKAKRVKKELTPEEIAQKERDKKKKQLKARLKDMDASRKEFIQGIITGKIAAVKNEDEVRERVWCFLLESGGYLSPTSMRSFFEGKNDYECSQEERDEAQKKVDGLSFTNSMLVALHHSAENASEIADWLGHYKAEVGKRLMNCYEILKSYGWTFENEDDEQILDGTHDLYLKEEKNDNQR